MRPLVGRTAFASVSCLRREKNREIITFAAAARRRNKGKKKRIVGARRGFAFLSGGKKAVATVADDTRLCATWIISSWNSGGKPARLRVTFGDLREISKGGERGAGRRYGRRGG